MSARLLLVALAALALWGCDDEKQAKTTSEAEQVTHAVKALREAEGDAKRPRLTALRGLACTAPDVCELRDECVEAFRLYLAGYDATAAVRRSLKEPSDGGATSAAVLLERAERDVRRGKERAARCTELEGQVRRTYGLP